MPGLIPGQDEFVKFCTYFVRLKTASERLKNSYADAREELGRASSASTSDAGRDPHPAERTMNPDVRDMRWARRMPSDARSNNQDPTGSSDQGDQASLTLGENKFLALRDPRKQREKLEELHRRVQRLASTVRRAGTLTGNSPLTPATVAEEPSQGNDSVSTLESVAKEGRHPTGDFHSFGRLIPESRPWEAAEGRRNEKRRGVRGEGSPDPAEHAPRSLDRRNTDQVGHPPNLPRSRDRKGSEALGEVAEIVHRHRLEPRVAPVVSEGRDRPPGGRPINDDLTAPYEDVLEPAGMKGASPQQAQEEKQERLPEEGGDRTPPLTDGRPGGAAIDEIAVWSEKSPLSAVEARPDNMDAGHWERQVAPGHTVKGSTSEDPFSTLRFGKRLSKQQKDGLLTVLRENEDVIAWTGELLGQTMIDYHRIDTGDARPVFIRPYRNSPTENAVVRKEVEKMIKEGIIRPSRSSWASPVVLVPKPSGEVRFCVDYRRLNACTSKDVHPLPRIEDALDDLAGSRFFSALDLRSGYWQVRMHADDIHKTAFSTQDGLYEFVVMPFGLTNAPATFQRVMNQVLGELLWKGVVVYLDDIIIHSRTWEAHLGLLRNVLARLSVANLRVSPSKSDFGFHELLYLGHIVSGTTVKMNPEKVRAVAEQPAPRNLKGIRAFLGLTSYYRRFVPHYASIAQPLNLLLRKGEAWKWGREQDLSFRRLRDAITKEPVLAAPNFQRGFLLQTDWSSEGLGAVLSQLDDEGQERVICYASRSLRPAERNYAAVEGECLGIVWACRLFRPYLHGRRFLLQTDQQALTSLMKAERLTGKLMRWALSLQEFSFAVRHRKGTLNANADALSRLPARAPNRTSESLYEVNTDRNSLPRPLVAPLERTGGRDCQETSIRKGPPCLSKGPGWTKSR